jgi:hypothetical protein
LEEKREVKKTIEPEVTDKLVMKLFRVHIVTDWSELLKRFLKVINITFIGTYKPKHTRIIFFKFK